jgi:DNA polymerase-3 subunit delta
VTGSPIAFIWGDDGYQIDAAVEAFRSDGERFPDGAPERWRVPMDGGSPARILGQLQERLLTGGLFGGGTLAMVPGVGPLVRRTEDRSALLATFALIAPGNGLVFAEETESGRKEAPHKAVVEAVRDAGGLVKPVQAPRPRDLPGWISQRARERQLNLSPDAAREIAARISGSMAEGDVDRSQQTRLAVMELDKLALFRLDGGPVTADDVRQLVAEEVPASLFAFTDAISGRNAGRAIELVERLLESEPEPVILTAVHRRLRELLEVGDRLAAGERDRDLPRTMKLHPYRAERLAAEASKWTIAELQAALERLLELDAMFKGVPGYPAGDAQRHLAFVRWISERVSRSS